MSRIVVKDVDKEYQIIEVKDKYITQCAKKFIDNQHPERVIIDQDEDGDLNLCVDEDGLPKELPVNFLLKCNGPWPVQKMVGTAVFIKTKPVNPYEEIWDYEVTDLTDKDMQIIRHILSEEYQDDCRIHFRDYGKGEVVITSFDNIELFR